MRSLSRRVDLCLYGGLATLKSVVSMYDLELPAEVAFVVMSEGMEKV